MRRNGIAILALACVITIAAPLANCADRSVRTENLLIVTFDGLRWQEVFNGADSALMNKDRGGIKDLPAVNRRYWCESVDARREALLPFLWGTVAKHGQLFGNRAKGSEVRVTNGLNFSYPGYNEIFCGFPDPRVKSNDPVDNPNVNVLEWLNRRPEFRGRIAAFGSWEVFPAILNAKRSGLLVNAGFTPLDGIDSPDVQMLNHLMAETPLAGEETRYDAFTFRAARAYLLAKKPRVLYMSFDETDAQGHAGRYDRLLDSAHKNDNYVQQMWELMQQMPQYQGKTSLIVTTDHGRGDPPTEWKSHGEKIKGSEFTWIGVLGPDTPALGERTNIDPVTHCQIAATIAALLGQDYNADVPRAGKPIPSSVGKAP